MPTFDVTWATWVRRAPTRPCVTWYGTGGDRVELSWTTADNWVAKTANYLVDGEGLAPGDGVKVEAEGWLGVVAHLGAWVAGLTTDGGAVTLGDAIRDEVLAFGDHYSGPSGAGPEIPKGKWTADDRVWVREGDTRWLGPLAAGASVVLSNYSLAHSTLGTERVTTTLT